MKTLFLLAPLLCLVALSHTSRGHPVPHIPVRSTFGKDGTLTIQIEVDPRCFAKDPLNEPYLENALFQTYSEEQKSKLFVQTKKLIADFVDFTLEPAGEVVPKFEMSFTSFANEPLRWSIEKPEENSGKCAETPVMVTATWRTDATGSSAYRIKTTKKGKFSVHFINHLSGEKQRLNVLFPGEESYLLDLKSWAESTEVAEKKQEKPSSGDKSR